MNPQLQHFLNSDVLTRYLVGETAISETQEVEHYLEKYPEVAQAYTTLQNNLEILAKADAVEPSPAILVNIHTKIAKEETAQKTLVQLHPKKTIPWYFYAASIAAICFACTTIVLLVKNKALFNENNIVVEEIFDLRKDIELYNNRLTKLSEELEKFNNPNSQKYLLQGNVRRQDLKTVAYINPIEKTSLIDIISLPQLPENQYYQIRAELEDKKVALGILDASQRTLKQIPYVENALALSIAIKHKDSLTANNEEEEVAEIALSN